MSEPARGAPAVQAFDGPDALADAVAQLVSTAVKDGLAQRGRASLVLSGGGTPALFLPRVAALDLPWERVTITLADERWVDERSPHSNAAMIRRLLLARDGPARARFIPLYNGAASAREGVEQTRAALPAAEVPWDLVLLGMGEDGHFASIFPHAARTAELLAPDNAERVAAVPAPVTVPPPVARITMTLAELRRSSRLALVLQSQRKREVLAAAFAAGDPRETPVVALGAPDVLWSA